MRKKLILFLSIFISINSFAATGWWDDFITIKSTLFYIGTNPGSGTQLNGYNFGTITDNLIISSADMKYWSDTQDRTGGAFYWMVKSSDNSTVIKGPYEVIWTHTYTGGNNYRGTWTGSIDVLTSGGSLTAGVTYKLHIYAKSWGTGQGDSWLSNGGNNYVATFTIDGAWAVELNSFSALLKNNDVVLHWQTSTEKNNYGFEIERSILNSNVSEKNWEKIGFVAGNGNSNSMKSYTFLDKNVFGNQAAYRLKQIDNDGKYQYYDEIIVTLNSKIRTELKQNFPNPFNPSTSIRFNLAENSKVSLEVYDVLGKLVKTLVNEYKPMGSYIVYWNGEDELNNKVSSGIYVYRLQVGNEVQIKRMNLIK